MEIGHARNSANSLYTKFGIASGPGALELFKDLSFLYVSHGVVMSRGCSEILFSWGSFGMKGSSSFMDSRKALLIALAKSYNGRLSKFSISIQF